MMTLPIDVIVELFALPLALMVLVVVLSTTNIQDLGGKHVGLL